MKKICLLFLISVSIASASESFLAISCKHLTSLFQPWTLKEEDKQSQIERLKENQKENFDSLFLQVPEDSITDLYRLSSVAVKLQLSSKELNAINDGKDLKQLLLKNNLVEASLFFWGQSQSWSHENWNEALNTLKQRTELLKQTDSEVPTLNFDRLRMLFSDTNNILKAFFPIDNIDLKQNINSFIIKKYPYGRLATYAKLQKTIDTYKLKNVHLPLKLLVARNKKTREYITNNQELEKLLKENLKIYVRQPHIDVYIDMDSESDDYELLVCAEKIQNQHIPLTPQTMQELQKLVTDAPFDIGHDNIFSNANGDAIIIDTEYKGEVTQEALIKINRYA